MSKFQIILLAVFGVVGVVAVLMFGGIIPGYGGGGGGQQAATEVVVWGPFENGGIGQIVSALNVGDKNISIKYVGKNSETYENDFLNALASGVGPDLWVVDQEILSKYKDKLFIVPFASYPERAFLDTFADVGETFIDRQQNGIIGFPLVIDPLVLYWNKELFASGGVSNYPKTWDEFLSASQSLTKLDAAQNIIHAGSAMGEYKNIKNAKGILSALFFQQGNPIIDAEKMETTLSDRGYGSLGNALKFFDEFSNPSKSNYSWNRSLARSDSVFINNALAMYFGYAGELAYIHEGNPHLEFDLALIPQIKGGSIKTTHAKAHALVLPKNSKNKQAAMSAVSKLTSGDFNAKFSALLNMGSSRRDVLGGGSENPILSVVYKSSIMARTWIEPDREIVSKIFQNMVESTVIGRSGYEEAIAKAGNQIQSLIKK